MCVVRLSWLIMYVGMILTVTVVITFMCWISSLFGYCNVVILFFVFFLYGLTMICLAFLTVPFFRKAELAANVVSFVAMAFGFLYLAVAYTRDFSHREGPVSAIPPWCQWLLALLSPAAVTLALDQVSSLFSTCRVYTNNSYTVLIMPTRLLAQSYCMVAWLHDAESIVF